MINLENLDKTALITKDQKISYRKLLNQIHSYSTLFKDNSHKRIAIFSENRLDWIYAFYAGWMNNCTIVPVDYMASADDVSFILNDCKPELIFSSEG
ncbi:MAG: long-chain fatty acid--CoA ligase, partial [bacterium]|nr:long-chain fatty acid--CoA ligase [bacterium]